MAGEGIGSSFCLNFIAIANLVSLVAAAVNANVRYIVNPAKVRGM